MIRSNSNLAGAHIVHQQGVVGTGILAALMVVVFVAAIAIKQSWRSDIDLKQAGHRWQGIQANAYIQGAETLARIALKKDAEADRAPIDTLDEEWAQPFDFPTDHGFMQIRISDAQSKLNLNALAQPYAKNANGVPLSGAAKYSALQRQFLRLLQLLPFDDDGTLVTLAQAEEILDAIIDWLDSDVTVTGFGGAEENYYNQLELPYTISNGPMVSISELARVKGVTRVLYTALRPYVSALGDADSVNAHTMSLALVQAINYDNDLSPIEALRAEAILEAVRSSSAEDTAALNDAFELSGLAAGNAENDPQPDTRHLVFASSWFEMDSTVSVGDTVKRYRSRLHRTDGTVVVERRSDANF